MKKAWRFSLSFTITLAFLLISTLIATLFFALYFGSVTSILKERAQNTIQRNAENMRAMISDNFTTWGERIKLAAISVMPYMNKQPLSAENKREIKKMLLRIDSAQSEFSRIVCLSNTRWNENGGFYITTSETDLPGDDYDNTNRSWFIDAKAAGGNVVFSKPFKSQITGEIVTNVAIDVLDDSGQSAGVMTGIVSTNYINSIIQKRNQYNEQKSYIITDDGLYVTSDDQQFELNKDFFAQMGLEEYRSEILRSESFSVQTGNYLFCSEFLPKANWFLVTMVPESVLFAEMRALVQRMILVAITAFIASCILVSLLTRKLIVRPIQEAEHIAEALAAEDFSIKIQTNRTDEIGSMLEAFIKIRDNLKGTIQTLNQDLLQAKEKAEDERDKAESANRAKSSFLASMSHEIRTPMNAIIGMSELIRTDNFDKTQKNYFADIRKMAHALLQIINDILDFSKIEAGKMDIFPVHFNILDLYENICSLTRFTASGKSIVFHHSFSPKVPPILYGDEVRIRQIITNIVNNAVKYTREGSVSFSIDYEQKDEKEFLISRVSDTGIGIKEEDISKIFIAFQQVDISKNQGILGTGLGLAITCKFVDMMKGSIHVESEYGKGSVFTVTLPLCRGNPALVKKESASNFIVSPDVKVLVVDDVALNLTVALGFLSLHGITADTASSAHEAIEKVKQTSYHLIFMDHMMPETDGVEATRRIRALYTNGDAASERFKTVPIVALTANAIAGMRDYFLQAGMNDFVAKPIEASKLNEVILSFLPPDKISYIDELPEEETNAVVKTRETLDALKKIEHIDSEQGLAYLKNNVSIYEKMLREFCVEFEEYIRDITALCEKADWQSYAIKIHAIKGICAGLSSEFLRAWAYKLEMASKGGDYEVCRAETAAFCADLGAVGNAIRAALQDELAAEEEEARPSFDRKTLVKKIAELAALCEKTLHGEAGAAAALEKHALELSKGSCESSENDAPGLKDELEASLFAICKLVNDFDYDQAHEKTQALLTLLAPR